MSAVGRNGSFTKQRRNAVLDAVGLDESDTTKADIEAALDNGDARVTDEVKELLMDSLTWEEEVIADIENTGEIPDVDRINSIVGANDANDRSQAQAVADAVSDEVLTREDLDAAVERADPTFREDVEAAISDASRSKSLVGGDEGDLVDQYARQASAPSRAEFASEIGDATSETVRVEEAVEDAPGRGSVSVVRDESGDPVGVLSGGGTSAESTQAVAEEFGVERVGSVEELQDGTEVVAEGGGRASLKFRGKKIGEVQV